MKKILLYITPALMAVSCTKTDDFLTKLPLDQLTDQTYWTSESNVRTFTWGFYPTYFTGYASGFDLSWGGYFSGESLNDDFAPTTPTPFTKTVPSTGGGWSFTNIRKANLFIERVKGVPMAEEAVKNWVGIGRFFRALEYSSKVRTFGDYPWYGSVITSENDTVALYKQRDPRELVMDSVLLDFKYAAENVRDADGATGPKGLIVNKAVVLAFMSRVFLFEGTWQKYQKGNTTKANEYLEAAKWAANEVMTKYTYTLGADYRKLFNSLDLSTNNEMIMYRRYEAGTNLLTHSLHSYVNKEAQTGASRNLVETYLAKDGLPIAVSPLYKGDKTIANVMADRDPRLNATIVPALRLNGIASNYSTSGYSTLKFFNDDIKDAADGNSNTNTTDAPIIRFGEVLMNYAEACAELGTLTQADLDKSINKLRKRTGINIPNLEVQGGLPAVAGVAYDDPNRDPLVPAMIWEIRRERRVELAMEGFRNNDLRRWKKLAYTDTKTNVTINRGAWVKKSDYAGTLSVTIEGGAAEGYLVPSSKAELERPFVSDKVYLSPLPLDQIKLYKDRGIELKQNPGWD
ncbi:RagB/SusD family nutrient uptake outer membrane protein [Paraflavitalea sp. CAU 1676]|uniref:RagB/SusD family nutrient uptake outer membrane protein n=1 Tax=Paraflavitalea sp. CAU 1676 TaxID=3032598 RepID=UPI0023DBC3F7|nr:RagB/SusD family nutrient uptake outer membrane protein [Paraflavitalea sp. CAU 1676]MDF2192813.1 RagB/SusD family nutrient uptake outer membrane protein [Paraflavitalea sp. CAU 1676]